MSLTTRFAAFHAQSYTQKVTTFVNQSFEPEKKSLFLELFCINKKGSHIVPSFLMKRINSHKLFEESAQTE